MTGKRKIITTISIAGGIALTAGTVWLCVWTVSCMTGQYTKHVPLKDGSYYVAKDHASYYSENQSRHDIVDAKLSISNSPGQEKDWFSFSYQASNGSGTWLESRTSYLRFGQIDASGIAISITSFSPKEHQPPGQCCYYLIDSEFKADGQLVNCSGDMSYGYGESGDLLIKIYLTDANSFHLGLVYTFQS